MIKKDSITQELDTVIGIQSQMIREFDQNREPSILDEFIRGDNLDVTT